MLAIDVLKRPGQNFAKALLRREGGGGGVNSRWTKKHKREKRAKK